MYNHKILGWLVLFTLLGPTNGLTQVPIDMQPVRIFESRQETAPAIGWWWHGPIELGG